MIPKNRSSKSFLLSFLLLFFHVSLPICLWPEDTQDTIVQIMPESLSNVTNSQPSYLELDMLLQVLKQQHENSENMQKELFRNLNETIQIYEEQLKDLLIGQESTEYMLNQWKQDYLQLSVQHELLKTKTKNRVIISFSVGVVVGVVTGTILYNYLR